MKKMLFVLLLAAPSFVLASPGSVDKYDCHNDPKTGEYHCHGSDDAAKQSHFLIGGSVRADSWIWNNGPNNMFLGGSLDAEYAKGPVGIHAGYSLQNHTSGSEGFTLSGWDIGLKLGKGLSRQGTHPYGEIGYHSQTFTHSDNTKDALGGYQVGAGFIINRSQLAYDFRVLYKDPSKVEQLWADYEFPGKVINLTTQFGVYFRY